MQTSSESPPLPEQVTTPMTGAGALRELFASLARDFPAARQLAWRLFLRDTRAAYRQSLLGLFWLFLPPLATTGVWIFLNSQQIVAVDSGAVPYPVFVLVGTVLWGAFNGSLTGLLGVVGEASSLVSKLNFPHEALLLSAFLKSFLNTLIQSLLLVPALLLFSFQPSATGILFFPVGLLALGLLGSACGVFLIPLATLYRDIGQATHLALRFGFFLTPVAYPIPATGVGRLLGTINPVSPLLTTTRGILTSGEAPLWFPFGLVVLASTLLLAASVVLYKLAMPRLIERLGS